jgi:DNA-binding CsgD family transcriptional regulator
MAEKFAEIGVASALSTLEKLKCAALVIDGRGVARHLNHLAEDLLGKDFNLCAGRPAARDPASNRRLQRLLASISAAGRDSVPIHDRAVIDRDGSPWLLVDTMPVTALGSDVFSPGRAVLTFTDLTAPPPADAALLALVFGLTAAEAKMAARIGLGNGIDEAATALRISRETARSQLKAVFLKTNTRRQAELVALISRLRPPI